MEYTNEYELGWGAWARYFGFSIRQEDFRFHYDLSSHWKNGWMCEAHPADGLFAASAWLTPEKTLSYPIYVDRPCIWIFCIDCGDLIFTRRGKPARKLTPVNHLFLNPGTPFRLTMPAGVHACFTSVLIFDDFINRFLTSQNVSYPIRLSDAGLWKESHVNADNIMLVMEQIRWGVRGNRLPPLAYTCKAIELLCMIAHNAQAEQTAASRRHYVTWNDEQKLYRVKEHMDKNPLRQPTTEEMCRLAHMSESKLRIAFKSLYGLTPFEYMRTAIMKRAMQMLADDELNIKNIASLCRYENPAKFTAAFKDVHGITPSQFRKSFKL